MNSAVAQSSMAQNLVSLISSFLRQFLETVRYLLAFFLSFVS
jgi:hypothetical protein